MGVILETYERALLARAHAWPELGSLAELGPAALAGLSRSQGIDFATAVAYDRFRGSERHGPFIRWLEALPDPRAHRRRRADVTVAIVPGAFYVEDPKTGADGRFVRTAAARLGCRSEVVPLASFGPVEENAGRLCEWLSRRPDRDIVLVSLSKGGAEVKTALARPGMDLLFRRVVLWVNVSGILQGTPAVRWLLDRKLRLRLVRLALRWRGHRPEVIRELDYGPGTPLDFELKLPDGLPVVHIAGFPLERHLSTRLARRGFRRLAPLGPNDGAGIVLADLLRLPGLTYPVWGADHYLRPSWDIEGLFARLVAHAAEAAPGLMGGSLGPEASPQQAQAS